MTDDYLYICPSCTTVTFEPIEECPACNHVGESLTLAFELPEGVSS